MLEVGDQLGDFRICRLLGRGGMGEVYEAYEPSLGRLVALKLLPDWMSPDPDAIERFQQEAATAARLEHPCIVPIYTWGRAGTQCFFTMKLIKGLSLAEFIRRRLLRERKAARPTEMWRTDPDAETPQTAMPTRVSPPERPDGTTRTQPPVPQGDASSDAQTELGKHPPKLMDPDTIIGETFGALHDVFDEYCRERFAFATRIGQQLAGALAYAHGLDQIHRDLKPSNVMIDVDGQVYLIDFGLTRTIDDASTHHRRGTLRYMSPEQLDLKHLDGRSDIYSLGVTLYETVASYLPFDGRDESAVAQQIRKGSVVPLETAAPGIPNCLAGCIQRAMHPRPKARYQTAGQMAADLAVCAKVASTTKTAAPSVAPPRRRKRGVWAAMLTLVLVAAGWLAYSYGGALFDTDQRGGADQANTTIGEGQPDRPPEDPGKQYLTNSIDMRLIRIPAGTFVMGSPVTEWKDEINEKPQHAVQISKAFYLGVFEVTQGEYTAVMGANPSLFTADKLGVKDASRYPVDSVSWHQAMEFCDKLSRLPAEQRAGRRYRLPTEAEWEYACRAGTTTAFHFGDEFDRKKANCLTANGAAGIPNEKLHPKPGGSYPPNRFGVYDMHGNVWEWCLDTMRIYDEEPQLDPRGHPAKKDRVFRGGCWYSPCRYCRSAFRAALPPEDNSDGQGFSGFRIVCEVSSP